MHARPAALLYAFLRRAQPGTRLGLASLRCGRCFDFGEASAIGVNALVRTEVKGGEEVLALASGPDAEHVLWAVAEVFAWRAAGNTEAEHTQDWSLISSLLEEGQMQARLLLLEILSDQV